MKHRIVTLERLRNWKNIADLTEKTICINPTHKETSIKEKLFTPNEVGQLFSRSVNTIHNWRRSGVFESIKLGGKYYFLRDQCLALLIVAISEGDIPRTSIHLKLVQSHRRGIE